MAENTTKPTGASVDGFIAALPTQRRRDESVVLVDMLRRVTGMEPVMWGPTMIGFDTYDYRYASGHTGTWFKVGFSPRSAKLSLYGIGRTDAELEQLARLGKHTLGAGCVYVNKLADIDLAALEALYRFSYEHFTAPTA